MHKFPLELSASHDLLALSSVVRDAVSYLDWTKDLKATVAVSLKLIKDFFFSGHTVEFK